MFGSCTLFVVHPDTQSLKKVTFHVTNYDGSVVLSCVTTLELSLLQPCNNLDFFPSSASLISSNADHPRKNRSQKNMIASKPSQNVCSSKEQYNIVLPSNEYQVNQCIVYKAQEKQASGSVKPMLFLCVMKRTVNIPSLFICGQCSQQ